MTDIAASPMSFRRKPGRLLFGAEALKVMIGVALIVLILFGQSFYGWATSNGRLDPALRDVTGRSNVIVVVNFTPDRFHNERISQYGTFAGRDGAINRLRLRSVSPDRLRQLSMVPWVARIEPFR